MVKISNGEYMTTEQYRQWVGYLTCGAIRAAIKAGRLDAIKCGKIWLINKNSIMQTNRTGSYIGDRINRKARHEKLLNEIRKAGLNPDDILRKDVNE